MLRKSKILLIPVVVAVQLSQASLALAEERDDQGRDPASESSRLVARDAQEGSEDDEYNFSWLDPDKKVYVLQNRKYRKKNRLSLFALGGANLSNPYRSELVFTPKVSFWFNENWGVEVFYGAVGNRDNSNLEALRKASPTALPFVRENRSYFGGVLAWNPWYAKLNFFNKILYFDWLIYAGAGQTSTAVDQNRRAGNPPIFVTETLTTFFFGTAHQYYVTRNFLVRIDLLGMLYNATGADNVTKYNTTNFDLSAGIGWAF